VDQDKLLHQLRNEKGTVKQVRRGLRNYSMAVMMIEAGVRVGELVKLAWSDVFYDSRPCTSTIIRAAIAKNRQERTIPVSQRLCEALTEYHLWYGPQVSPSANHYLFFVLRPSNPIAVRQAERIIDSAGRASLGRPINPHLLRHTFATRLMRVSNVRVLQQLLGHTCLSSTQVYTHPDHQDLTQAIARSEKFTRDLEGSLPASTLLHRRPDRHDATGTDHHHR